MDPISQHLIAAQNKTQRLFDDVVGSGLIRAGTSESELTAALDIGDSLPRPSRMIGGFFEELLTLDAGAGAGAGG